MQIVSACLHETMNFKLQSEMSHERLYQYLRVAWGCIHWPCSPPVMHSVFPPCGLNREGPHRSTMFPRLSLRSSRWKKKKKKKKQTSSTRRTSHSPLIDWLTLLVAIIFLRPCYQMEPVSAGTWSCLMHLLLCEQMDREETADITQSGGCKKLKRADCVQLGSAMIKGENRYLGKLPV